MIYLLRHGEIDGNEKKRFIGQTDVPLSPKGLQQAQWWKKELSRIDFESVYSSNLIRAFDTASIVSDNSRLHIDVMTQLREINLGEWDGEVMENIRNRFPDAWKERGRHIANFRTPNGESFQDLYDRVIPVFLKLTAAAHGNVLVVAHAGVNRVILCHALKKPIQELLGIPQEYAALNLIGHQKGKLHVLSINRTPSQEMSAC